MIDFDAISRSLDLGRVGAMLGGDEIPWTDEPWDRVYRKARRGKPPLERPVVNADPAFRSRVSGAKWTDYDRIIVSFSGGKDSEAALIHLLDAGAPPSLIELWHQNIDGDHDAPASMDWPVTRDYIESVATVLGLPVLYQWRGEGLYGEMARRGRHMHPIYFESPADAQDGLRGVVRHALRRRSGAQGSRSDDLVVYRWDTKAGRLEGRRGMPARSPDLQQRWCSDVVKIEPFDKALLYDPRFNSKRLGRKPRILVVTGERRLEGKPTAIEIVEPNGRSRVVDLGGRAAYALLEPHGTNAPTKRLVDHWRPILNYTDEQVWAALESRDLMPHPAYQLGPWGRCSCSGCIYSSPWQFAAWRTALPDQFARIADLDETLSRQKRMTLREGTVLRTVASRGAGDPRGAVDPAAVKRWKPYFDGRKRITPKDVVGFKRPKGASAGYEGGSANVGLSPALSLSVIEKYIPMMEARGVSEVARSDRGFLTAYRRAGGDLSKLGLTPDGRPWVEEREGFIARHMAQVRRRGEPLYEDRGRYKGEPRRRHLALIAWAYSPDKGALNRQPQRSSRQIVVPPLTQIVDARETETWRAQYKDTQGTAKSSRYAHARGVPTYPTGTWRIDRMKGLYGRLIEQLVELDPRDVEDVEGMVETNEQGRGEDARRYAGWIRSGLRPPPISVIEREDGQLRVSDGHRRLAAAKLAGVPVLAWVSWTVDGDSTDWQGKPIGAGLTWELAVRRGLVRDGAANHGSQIRVDDLVEGVPTGEGIPAMIDDFDGITVIIDGEEMDLAYMLLVQRGDGEKATLSQADAAEILSSFDVYRSHRLPAARELKRRLRAARLI